MAAFLQHILKSLSHSSRPPNPSPPPFSPRRLPAAMASSSSSSSSSPPPISCSLPDSPHLAQLHPESPHIETLKLYHDKTKHNFRRYADGPHGLDWANQPSPFRRFDGAPKLPLLHFPPEDPGPDAADMPYPDAFSGFHGRGASPRPSKETVSRLLYDSFSLSAWKKAGMSTWSLRVNPSSGNLHPTEAYVVGGAIPGISNKPFVAHYYPRDHALEIRCEIPGDLWEDMKEGLPDGVLFLGLTSIYWRESWKYGERAFRYCNHDVGHALGAISMAGAGVGWDAILLDGWGNEDLDCLLGVHGRGTIPKGSSVKGSYPELEQEHADCLVACFPVLGSGYGGVRNSTVPSPSLKRTLKPTMIQQAVWAGKPNKLSKDHVWWGIIDDAASASKKATAPSLVSTRPIPAQAASSTGIYAPSYTLRRVIIKRRSAVNMDGDHVISARAFYHMMAKTLPSGPGEVFQGETAQIPFRILPWKAEVHMAIFVHRVEGLPKGLYFVVRNSEHEARLRKSLRHGFDWEKPDGCPDSLPLYRLLESDCEDLAMRLSCHQEIAAFGSFSLGMIARFEVLNERGAWMYPRLYWECGVLGQLLYLEAHAIGISATGIGCYFDDPVHEVLGLKGKEFQSLYHFTVGAPVEDKRITGLPPYPAPKYARE